MGILNIKPVKSGQSKAVLGIAGVSGGGKTYTALLIARGMVDKPEEIGFLDTENKRGSLYANILDGPFMIGDLYPPFTPQRYAQAIKEFQEAGIKVLIIDSVTHEWEGEGGCEDIANLPLQQGKKMANWIGAKKEHKTFMNTLLQSNMDIICCIRAREKTDFKDPTKPVSLGIQPVCEKNFMFEMTASFLIIEEGKKQVFLKIPSFLKESFGNGNDYLGVNTGKKLRKWLNEGERDTPEIEKLKSDILMSCEKGTEELMKIWNSLDSKKQAVLKNHFSICKESALAYDKLNNQSDDIEEKLNTLFEEKKEKIDQEQLPYIENIVKQKKVSEYEKALNYLNKL